MKHPKALQKLIKENKECWWWLEEDRLVEMSLESVVEGLLNYADLDQIRQLFEIVGVDKVAEVFYGSASFSRKLGNYQADVLNYFNLYFQKHARGNFTNPAKKINSFVENFYAGVLSRRGDCSCFADRTSAIN